MNRDGSSFDPRSSGTRLHVGFLLIVAALALFASRFSGWSQEGGFGAEDRLSCFVAGSVIIALGQLALLAAVFKNRLQEMRRRLLQTPEKPVKSRV